MRKKLKLTSLTKNEIFRIKGGAMLEGCSCACSCAYANCEGSSSGDNGSANAGKALEHQGRVGSKCWGDCC